jgi:hypothetical protein
MHETQILDTIDSISLGKISFEDKALIVADIKHELSNKRFAGQISSLIMQKIDDLSKGMYKIAQSEPKIFQDFEDMEAVPKPFDIINKDEIDKFLDKMMSKEPKETQDSFFGDTWEFYHPTANMVADGVARHRSDFVVKS